MLRNIAFEFEGSVLMDNIASMYRCLHFFVRCHVVYAVLATLLPNIQVTCHSKTVESLRRMKLGDNMLEQNKLATCAVPHDDIPNKCSQPCGTS